jgi:EXS family
MSSTQEVGNLFFVGPAHAMLRSPTVLIASVGLWGMNVYFYRLFGIDYIKVLKHDLIKLKQQDVQMQQQQQQQQQQDAYSSTSNGGSAQKSIMPASTMRHKNSNHIELTGVNAGASSDNDTMQSTADYYCGDNVSDVMMDDDSISSLVSLDKKDSDDGSTTITLLPKSSIVTSGAVSPSAAAAIHAAPPSSSSSSSPTVSAHAAATAAASITWERLVGLSMTLLFLLHFSYYWWIDTLGGGLLGAVYFFYSIVVLLVVLPLHCTTWLRRAVHIVLYRSLELINPRWHCLKSKNASNSNSSITSSSTAALTSTSAAVYIPRSIPFVDVFFADAMCSLSKVFFDWGMLLLMAYYHSVGARNGIVPKSLHSILIPSFCAAIPYIIRARQCLIMYHIGRLTHDTQRNSHLWNALKYTTSIFPLCLSAFQKTASRQLEKDLEVYLVFLLVLNSTFALYWDVVMDWGMYQSNPIKIAFCGGPSPQKQSYYTQYQYHPKTTSVSCSHTIMRPRLRFGTAMSALILITDVILRFSWMLRFGNKMLFPSQDSFVLCTQFLEVFRRAMWNLLRVEWENLKQLNAANNTGSNNNSNGSTGTLLSLDTSSSKKKSSPLPTSNTNPSSNSSGSISSGGGRGGSSSPSKLMMGDREQQQQRKNAAAAVVAQLGSAEEMTSFLPSSSKIENSNANKKPSSWSSWLRWQTKTAVP